MDDPIIRTNIAEKGDIWVGQRVVLNIDVLSADGWAKVGSIRDFEVAGALVLRLETQGVRLNEKIDGKDYSGQRYSVNLYPQRGGACLVPAIPLNVSITTYGSGGGVHESRAETKPFSFQVKVPPGAEDIEGLISTTDLTTRQRWTPEPENFKVGDAIERSLTFEAADISGMAFTPTEFAEIQGAAVYPDDAKVNDQYDRGDLTGTRIDSATYVFDRPGTATLPDISFSWWNLKTSKLENVEFEGIRLDIATTPEYEAALAAAKDDGEAVMSAPEDKTVFAAVILAAGVIALFLFIYRDGLARRWNAWQEIRSKSEQARFRRLLRAARENDASSAYLYLTQWLNAGDRPSHIESAESLFDRYGDASDRDEYQSLLAALSQNEPRRWEGGQFANRLSAIRVRYRRSLRLRRKSDQLLPPLNP